MTHDIILFKTSVSGDGSDKRMDSTLNTGPWLPEDYGIGEELVSLATFESFHLNTMVMAFIIRAGVARSHTMADPAWLRDSCPACLGVGDGSTWKETAWL